MDTSCPKQYIDESNLDIDIFKMNWALPAESWIISTVKFEQQQSLSIRKSKELKTENLFLGPYLDYPYEKLNKEYFGLVIGNYCD